MTEFKYIINNISNIHARPLSELAKIAKDSNCEVSVKKGENSKDLKKIIGKKIPIMFTVFKNRTKRTGIKRKKWILSRQAS